MAWIGLYHFDDTGSATVVDVSGNGRDIDLTGTAGAQVTGGQTGSALGKTGATMPELPSALRTAAETDDRGLMFDVLGTGRSVWWVRWNSSSLGSGIWGVLSLDGSTLISRARRQSDSAAAGALTIGTLSATVWHNVCVTYKRSTGVLSVYWDGALVTAGVPSGWSAGTQLMVGASDANLAEWSSTGPAIDNLRVADHCPDVAEVASLAGTAVTETEVTGSGSVTAPTVVVSGAAAVVVSASGAVSADTAAVDGDGSVVVSGAGTATAAAAALAGSGAASVAGQGSAEAGLASLAGSGQVIVTGTGSAVAPAAAVSGAGGEPSEPVVTPEIRTVVVPAENRVMVVAAESRVLEA